MAYIDWVDHGMQAVGLLPHPPCPRATGRAALPRYMLGQRRSFLVWTILRVILPAIQNSIQIYFPCLFAD